MYPLWGWQWPGLLFEHFPHFWTIAVGVAWMFQIAQKRGRQIIQWDFFKSIQDARPLPSDLACLTGTEDVGSFLTLYRL